MQFCKHLFILLCVKVSSWTSSLVVQAHDDCVCAWCQWLPWISRSACANFSGLSSTWLLVGMPYSLLDQDGGLCPFYITCTQKVKLIICISYFIPSSVWEAGRARCCLGRAVQVSILFQFEYYVFFLNEMKVLDLGSVYFEFLKMNNR